MASFVRGSKNESVTTVVPTPIGDVTVTYHDNTVIGIELPREGARKRSRTSADQPSSRAYPLNSPPRQIAEYFEGRRTEFDVELDLTGASDFDLAVWKQMLQIPYGASATYGQIAQQMGRPGAARAVGGAAHRNPIPLIIPCHRVVGSDGALTGFGPGISKKAWLLDLEAHPR